ILSGRFYIEAAMVFLSSLVMAFIESADIPDFSVSLFGLVSAMTFFLPGLKYYRQQQKSLAAAASRK
ncbi:MAG: serine/threonine protein kinase, partial [Planctomycetaceae bacterium]